MIYIKPKSKHNMDDHLMLFETTRFGKIDQLVNLLRDQRVNVNAWGDPLGNGFVKTALHFAAESGQAEACRVLVDFQADVHAETQVCLIAGWVLKKF